MENEFVIALKKKQCPERQGKGHDCHGVPNTPLKQSFPECCISLRTKSWGCQDAYLGCVNTVCLRRMIQHKDLYTVVCC